MYHCNKFKLNKCYMAKWVIVGYKSLRGFLEII